MSIRMPIGVRWSLFKFQVWTALQILRMRLAFAMRREVVHE